MKKILIAFMLGVLLVTSVGFVEIPNAISQRNALHILVTMDRKAWMSFNTDIVGSSKPKVTRITKFGYNRNVSNLANESMVPWGGLYDETFGLSAETLSVVSNNVNDTAGGTGARTILIGCIDEDGLEVDVPVTMNGTTPVITTQTCKFNNRATVITSGSTRRNEGTITITQTSSGVQLSEIPVHPLTLEGRSVTQQLMYYVPSNKKCYMDVLELRARKTSGGQAPRVEFNVMVYSQSQDTVYDIREYFLDTDVDPDLERHDFKAEPLRPNEIISIDVDTNIDATIVTGSLELTCREI